LTLAVLAVVIVVTTTTTITTINNNNQQQPSTTTINNNHQQQPRCQRRVNRNARQLLRRPTLQKQNEGGHSAAVSYGSATAQPELHFPKQTLVRILVSTLERLGEVFFASRGSRRRAQQKPALVIVATCGMSERGCSV